MNVQENFLSRSVSAGTAVTVYLCNNYKLVGRVLEYDGDTILLESEGRHDLIYKHSIVSIVPLMNDSNGNEEAGPNDLNYGVK